MAVLRLVRCAPAVFVSVLLAACSGSTESTDSVELSLSGSVGDGPVVGAAIRITDAEGTLLEEHTSDDLATYQLSLAGDAALPVLLTATGGTDLVTGRELDFTLLGAALETGSVTVNVSPLTTLAVRAAQCTEDGLTAAALEEAWRRVHAELGMGLDADLVADPMGEPVSRSNVESVVLANEALGEAVRRTALAMEVAGSPASGDEILSQIACDLMGRNADTGGLAVEPRVLVAFKAAELNVRLETLAGRLEVDGTAATDRMNAAIRVVAPDFPNPSVTRVAVTEAAREQTLALISLFQELADNEALVALAADLNEAQATALPGRVDAALTASLHGDLQALATNVAFADDTVLAEIEERRDQQPTAPRPVVSLAANPAEVELGDSVSISWASSVADQCVSSWSGAVGT